MKEKVIVLRTIKFGESDLIIHGLNSRGGRVNFIARGALKSRRRFSGGILEPSHYIIAHYRPASSRHDEAPLHHLQEAELLKGFNGLRENYDRLELALAFLALVSRVAQPGVEDSPELFDLLGNGLFAAEASHHLDILRLQFEFKLAYLQGILPADITFSDLLRRPLKDHGLIVMESDEIRRLQTEVRLIVRRYLEGLSPFGAEGVEI